MKLASNNELNEFPHSRWRLIPLLQASGKVQMAIDRWLMEQHRLGKHPPALRFYTWSPVAISLGYHQRRSPEFWRELVWKGEPVQQVRRPTGGRAVLHQGDLTYMVVTSGLPLARLQAYKTLCEFLIQGWKMLGVELFLGSARRIEGANPNCFGSATGADLVFQDGAKFIGSAQLRRDGAILQHGSMQLEPDAELTARVFSSDRQKFTLPLLQRYPHLQEKQSTPIEKAIDALVASFSSCFAAELVVQPLCDREWAEILEIINK